MNFIFFAKKGLQMQGKACILIITVWKRFQIHWSKKAKPIP